MTERSDDEKEPFSQSEDGVTFEPEEELGSVGALQAKLKKTRAELEHAKKEVKEYLDGWQRCKADSVNAKREALQHAERVLVSAKEMFVAELVPALDSFDAARRGAGWESLDATWKSGVEQIQNQLLAILSRHGVERYGAAGDKFDPALHEVGEEVEEGNGEPGSIVTVLRFGYKAGDRVLRPAQVIIKSHPKSEPEVL